MNDYFDNVYLLNLHKRIDRLILSEKKLEFVDLDYEVFGATDGSVMNFIWKSFSKENAYFKNSNYLGCAISHLSIYKDAIEKGYEKVLIIEDDNRYHRNLLKKFKEIKEFVPRNWNELLYLGYIPLSDDCLKWDYGVFSNNYINEKVFVAKNLWGLYGYAIHANLMVELLEVYDKKFPMELDRYFVNEIQPRNKSYGVSPQLFCAEDGFSDNSKKVEISMMERSVDRRFAKLTDYI
jgi:GR25 family glycosyltransferase involved in LPS biosynthesis